MLYQIVRPFAKIGFLLNFKKIYLTNDKVIPWDKPVILAINHPSAFLETCILATILPKPLYFLVRGDIWVKEFYNRLMRGVHLIPIYRQKDGYSNLTKNYETFDYCYEALAQKKPLMVLPEGTTIQVKRLRPIKKGLARICFGALDKYPNLDIHIVPIGANFTYADKPRSEVMFEFGEPIRVVDYEEEFQKNPKRAELLLTLEIERRMKNCIIHIDHHEDEELVEKLFILDRNGRRRRIFPVQSGDGEPLRREKQIATWVNHLLKPEKSHLAEKAEVYFEKLKTHGVTDEAVLLSSGGWPYFAKMTVGFLPWAAGTVLNAGAIWLAKRITRDKVDQLEFFAPVFLALAIFLWVAFYGITIMAAIWVNKFWLWAIVAAAPFLGIFSIFYNDEWRKLRFHRNASALSETVKTSLLNEREVIVSKIRQAVAISSSPTLPSSF